MLFYHPNIQLFIYINHLLVHSDAKTVSPLTIFLFLNHMPRMRLTSFVIIPRTSILGERIVGLLHVSAIQAVS